jgi:hypothetical protein
MRDRSKHVSLIIDAAGLRRAAQRAEGGGFSIHFARDRSSVADDDAVGAAVGVANRLFGDLEDIVSAAAPATTPRGPVAYVQECDSNEALDAWLTGLGASLQEQGWSGKVREIRTDATPYDRPGNHVEALGAGVVLPIDPSVLDARLVAGGSNQSWLVDPDTTRHALGPAVEFVLRSPGELYALHGLTQFRIDPVDAANLVANAIAVGPPVALTRVAQGGDLARLYLGHLGHVHYEARNQAGGWPAEVSALSTQLRAHADHAEYGLIRRIWSVAVGWDGLVDLHPPRPPSVRGSYAWFTRHLESSRVPDAYGHQLLTDEHLNHAHDLSRWRIEKISTRLYEVIAREPEAWFANGEPSSGVIDRARADFGDMILTRPEVKSSQKTLRARIVAAARERGE